MHWVEVAGKGKAEIQSTFGQTFPECRVPQDILHRGKGRGCFAGSVGGVSSGLVQPFSSFGSLARVYVYSFLTVLTLHRAAPLELALALGDLLDSRGVVATPTAHDLTAVCAARCLIADPSGCAQGTCNRMAKQNLLVPFHFSATYSALNTRLISIESH